MTAEATFRHASTTKALGKGLAVPIRGTRRLLAVARLTPVDDGIAHMPNIRFLRCAAIRRALRGVKGEGVLFL